MKLLLTGGAGYTGKGLAQTLREQGHFVRSCDLKPAGDSADESVLADIGDLAACRQAVAGMEAIVMCHMAPNPDGYKEPPLAIDVNVKGTANLYHAAVEQGLSRCVLISSAGVVNGAVDRNPRPGDGPYQFKGTLYVLTKVMQEAAARFYHENHGVRTAILRPGWIVYDDTFISKYGVAVEQYEPTLIDPRDIGLAAAQALALPDPGLEVFHLAQDDAKADLASSHSRLDWRPKHRFERLPRPEKKGA